MISQKKPLSRAGYTSLSRALCSRPSDRSQADSSEQAARGRKPEEIEQHRHRPHAETAPGPPDRAALGPLALRTLFRLPECSTLDGLNEYDEDYRFFSPFEKIVTREVRQAVATHRTRRLQTGWTHDPPPAMPKQHHAKRRLVSGYDAALCSLEPAEMRTVMPPRLIAGIQTSRVDPLRCERHEPAHIVGGRLL